MIKAIGLTAPTSFPDTHYGVVLAAVQNHCAAKSKPEDLREFCEAWNGLAYRYLAAIDSSRIFTSSFQLKGGMPAPQDRYDQERALFSFFAEALSMFETLGRGVNVIGRLSGVAFASKPRPYPRDVAKALRNSIPTDPLTVTFCAMVSSPMFEEMKETRDTLSHGGSPPRKAFVGGQALDPEWGSLRISSDTTARILSWIESELPKLFAAMAIFASQL